MAKMSRVKIMVSVLVGVSSAIAQSSSTLAVSGSRPFMKAIDALEKHSGIPINYEDPPFQHSEDLQDVTEEAQSPQQRAANPNARIIVPKRGQLVIESALLAQKQLHPSYLPALLTQLRVEHDAQKLSGRFVVVEREAMTTVEPSGIRTKDRGELLTVSSVLNARITVPFQQRNALECLVLFAKQAGQAAGVRIDVGAYPVVAFANANVTCGAADESANVVLPKFFGQISGAHSTGIAPPLYSYRLLYDPQLRYYLLNINSVPTNTSNMLTTTPALIKSPEPTGFLLQKKK